MGNSTNKKDAQSNAARDFVNYLVRVGEMNSSEVPALGVSECNAECLVLKPLLHGCFSLNIFNYSQVRLTRVKQMAVLVVVVVVLEISLQVDLCLHIWPSNRNRVGLLLCSNLSEMKPCWTYALRLRPHRLIGTRVLFIQQPMWVTLSHCSYIIFSAYSGKQIYVHFRGKPPQKHVFLYCWTVGALPPSPNHWRSQFDNKEKNVFFFIFIFSWSVCKYYT